jgi:hypothetical protein
MTCLSEGRLDKQNTEIIQHVKHSDSRPRTAGATDTTNTTTKTPSIATKIAAAAAAAAAAVMTAAATRISTNLEDLLCMPGRCSEPAPPPPVPYSNRVV